MALSPLATHRAQARVGTLLNEKWRLDSLLGLGGMAAVYGASHRNGKRAALKMLHPELNADPALVTRFLREGYLANKVGHPGVVSVLDDAQAEDGSPYLVMELLDGYSLEKHTQNAENALPLGQVLQIADELLDVLAAAHAMGIVHRDIKPANLFLTREGRVKVLDFGIARLAEPTAEASLTQTGAAIGTPSYMPPEQARGRWTEVDARTDLWAVGATMLALMIGHRPRRGETVQEELLLAMTAPLPSAASLCPQLPDALAQAFDHSVAFERERRFPDARTMQLALRRAAEANPNARVNINVNANASAALDHTVLVSAVADTAPIMHEGRPQPSARSPLASTTAESSGLTSPITSPSHAGRTSAPPGSTVQMAEPQLTTGRGMWVAPPAATTTPSRGAGAIVAIAAAIVVLTMGVGGVFAWKRHQAKVTLSQPSDRPVPANAAATDAPPSPPPATDLPPPANAASTSAVAASMAPAGATAPSASHAAAPRASGAPRGPAGPRGSAAPTDTSGFFNQRF